MLVLIIVINAIFGVEPYLVRIGGDFVPLCGEAGAPNQAVSNHGKPEKKGKSNYPSGFI